jgi:hypothetical protein
MEVQALREVAPQRDSPFRARRHRSSGRVDRPSLHPFCPHLTPSLIVSVEKVGPEGIAPSVTLACRMIDDQVHVDLHYGRNISGSRSMP